MTLDEYIDELRDRRPDLFRLKYDPEVKAYFIPQAPITQLILNEAPKEVIIELLARCGYEPVTWQ